MGLWQDMLGKNSFSVRASAFLTHRDATVTIFFFFFERREVNCAIFSSGTNRWSVWSTYSFSRHVFTLSFLSLSLSFSLSPDTQALQCMLISLQAELDIQRYLMKIESSQRVSTLPFLFSALSRTLPPAFLPNCVWHSNQCQPLNRVPVLCLVCPSPDLNLSKPKCLHSEM